MLASHRAKRTVLSSCFQPSLLPDAFLDHRTHQHQNQNQPRDEGLSPVADAVVTSSAPVLPLSSMSPSQQSAGFAQTPPPPSPNETVCLRGSWSRPSFGVSPACPGQGFSSSGVWARGPGSPLFGGVPWSVTCPAASLGPLPSGRWENPPWSPDPASVLWGLK